MQKLILLLLASLSIMGFIAGAATANLTEPLQAIFAMKIDTIAKMYQQDVNNQGQDYPVVLEQYASQELQTAIQLERDYFDKEQISCHVGYDVLWDSQDPDYAQDKQFAVTTQGLIKVSLAQGSDVYYKMSCDSTDDKVVCYVADVILDEDGTSLKNHLIENCL